MATCGCLGDTCGCSFELPLNSSTFISGAGTLSDPYRFTASHPGYVRAAARSSFSGTQALNAADVDVVATMDTEVFDLDNMVDISGFPTRITIKTDGYYMVGGQVKFNTTVATTQNSCKIRRNGSIIESQDSESDRAAAANIYVTSHCFVSCSVGDYFECVFAQILGGGTYSVSEMHLWAIRMGSRV